MEYFYQNTWSNRLWIKTAKRDFSIFSSRTPEAYCLCSEERGVRKELYEGPAVTWLTAYRRFAVG
eukprot:2584638-Pyramimonas_sp.AAC.1